ncbi:MAG: hypothetical protein JST00_44980 [Deltaproteobacteria bacterium]|nr:hypothetical protein [Deltaproteobacteria bacterium]
MSSSSNTRVIGTILATASLAILLAACSSDDGGSSGTTSGTSGATSTSSSSGATSSSSGASSSSASSSGASGSSGTTSSSSGSSGVVVDGIPAGDPVAFNAWLQKKEYETWPKESAPHASTGPHGQSVQTYLNPKLDASMKGSAEHPVGAAAVKTFNANGKVTGWAAMVKTAAASDGGKGWYWYEVFDTAPGASPIAGQGLGTCTGCHSSGKDFVRAPYPLQ